MDDGGSKKARYPLGYLAFLEAPPRFGLGIEVLQTFALPLGHGAIFHYIVARNAMTPTGIEPVLPP